MSRGGARLLATLAVLAIVVAWLLWEPSPPERGAPPSPATASEAKTGRPPKAGPSPDATAQAGPSGAERIEATSSFSVIDDASGEVLSWGVP